MAGIDYSERIPNNVSLADNRRLQRALEEWHPKFLDWWMQMGPDGFQGKDVYLRTAVSVDAQGWAQFDYVKMPEYRWGLFLAEPEAGRTIGFGDHLGAPAWQDVPGEYRGVLRRLIVTQGDTEPASVEQQRHLGRTCPSLYDLRNLFQINVEEGRHLWAWSICSTPTSAATAARSPRRSCSGARAIATSRASWVPSTRRRPTGSRT